MKRGIRNADTVAYKLKPALIRATNEKLEVTRKERQKREEMVEKRKTKAMATRCQWARREISLSREEEENYESDTGDETDLDQPGNNKNLLQLWERGVKERYK